MFEILSKMVDPKKSIWVSGKLSAVWTTLLGWYSLGPRHIIWLEDWWKCPQPGGMCSLGGWTVKWPILGYMGASSNNRQVSRVKGKGLSWRHPHTASLLLSSSAQQGIIQSYLCCVEEFIKKHMVLRGHVCRAVTVNERDTAGTAFGVSHIIPCPGSGSPFV